MTININISDTKLESLSDQGLTKLQDFGSKYLNDILDESQRIAMSRNTANTDPEITAAIVTDAEVYCRKYRTSKRRQKKGILFQIGTYVLTLITGGLFDLDNFEKKGYLIIFLILFGITITTGIMSIMLGDKND